MPFPSSPGQTTLTLIGDDGCNRQANVFIHGYRAITSQKAFEALKARILHAQPAGKVYLLYWRSGSWAPSLAAYVSRAAFYATHTRLLRLNTLLIELALTYSWEATLYKRTESTARRLGRDLDHYLQAIDCRTINLIGHSLGTGVIEHHLANTDQSPGRIHDCVLLGGTAALKAPWSEYATRIQGNLYNGYSKADIWLMNTPCLHRHVGRHPITPGAFDNRQRIHNTRCRLYHHTNYWPQLNEVLPQIWPEARWRLPAARTTE